MAEDALKDEPEWSVDREPDQGEIVITLKEKEKIKEKTTPKKKLTEKQQQLQQAAKNSSARSDPLLLSPPSYIAKVRRLLQTKG